MHSTKKIGNKTLVILIHIYYSIVLGIWTNLSLDPRRIWLGQYMHVRVFMHGTRKNRDYIYIHAISFRFEENIQQQKV
jgi:hypothetical protein